MAAALVLTTLRLRLTRPTRADADGIFHRYSADPEVTRYLAWPRHRSVRDAEAFIAFSDAEWSANGYGPYLIWRESPLTLLGSTGLHAAGGEVQTGYVLARDAWGYGFATEALTEMVSLARRVTHRRSGTVRDFEAGE